MSLLSRRSQACDTGTFVPVGRDIITCSILMESHDPKCKNRNRHGCVFVWSFFMSKSVPTIQRSFRVHFIGLDGPEEDLTVRILFVETLHGKPIYEGFASWAQCEIWIAALSGWMIKSEVLINARQRVEQRRLATIKGLHVSADEIRALGFSRVDG